MRKAFLLLTVLGCLLTACGSKQPQGEKPSVAISTRQNVPGDMTRYGLACDGSTDSILVFLPFEGGDPDTFDIVDAQLAHRVFGRARIGDEVAVLPADGQPGVAQSVININRLQGQWCYMVTPTLRTTAAGQPPRQLPDSIRQRIMVPREYGLRIKRDNTAHSIGGQYRQATTDDMSPVVYPTIRNYTEWRIFNGQIILKSDTIPGMGNQQAPQEDTVTVVLLRRDSLVLRFADREQGFYRKQQEPEQQQEQGR